MRFCTLAGFIISTITVFNTTADCKNIFAADAPSVDLALTFRPVQKNIEIDTPTKAEYPQCKVQVERKGKASGWVVFGPAGQPIRRYIDTNADNVVDQWRYYQQGLEVYRDIDSNFNNKVDQSRWFNTGGSRWGIDKNEDGIIDSWKVLSAEEATQEAIYAMAKNDAKKMASLFINKADIKSLGINAALAAKLVEASTDLQKKITAATTKSKLIESKTKWSRFDASMPNVIPSDEEKATTDITVYENVMAIVETGGQRGFVQIGEMIKVGDVWKLTQIPKPMEGDSVQVSAGGILMQPALASATTGITTLPATNTQMQKLLDDLQKLDANSPSPTAGQTALTQYNSKRIGLLNQLIEKSQTEQEKDQWTRQLTDGLTAAIQSGAYKDGLKQLKTIQASVRKNSKDTSLHSYVAYRTLLADYSNQIQVSDNQDLQKVQEWWLLQLETFVTEYSKSEESAEAGLQLAITQEFSGKIAEAQKWYKTIVAGQAKTPAGIRAAGALKRLNLKGNSFNISGPGLNGGTLSAAQYRGKYLLVVFGATWCKPCTEDLPQLRALYEQYQSRGFEILGINLDMTAEPAPAYIQQHRIKWKHIHQPGGLESEPARQYGIISLPTMFLVDKQGKVISRSTSAAELKTLLPELTKTK